jgi:hypothetical protein
MLYLGPRGNTCPNICEGPIFKDADPQFGVLTNSARTRVRACQYSRGPRTYYVKPWSPALPLWRPARLERLVIGVGAPCKGDPGAACLFRKRFCRSREISLDPDPDVPSRSPSRGSPGPHESNLPTSVLQWAWDGDRKEPFDIEITDRSRVRLRDSYFT